MPLLVPLPLVAPEQTPADNKQLIQIDFMGVFESPEVKKGVKGWAAQ
jgi:hypothetical protein